MASQLLQPQEIEVLYILPTIRKYLTEAMKELGLNQKEIAKRLYVQESTISQYLSSKRASNIRFNDKLKQEIIKSASEIKDKASLVTETQRLLKLAWKDQTICMVHKQYAELPSNCNYCEFYYTEKVV